MSLSGKRPLLNSLTSRLILSALLLIVILLPTIGIALNKAFKQQVLLNTQDQLSAYLYGVLAVTEMEEGELLMPERLLDNQFNVINSGLYALITQQDQQGKQQLLWASNSFLGQKTPTNLAKPKVGQGQFGELLLDKRPHLIYSFSVRFDSGRADNDTAKAAAPISLHIIKDLDTLAQQQQAFGQHLWLWLMILMLVLLVIQFTWLRWTLKPLAKFEQELKSIQSGQSQQLSKDYPTELQTVATQLNTLLSTEQSQRRRYRNALSDLAHSLKTPLAVIQSQKDLNPCSLEQVEQINRTISHQLKRAQSAASNAWHLGIKVKSVADKLLRTLHKIHPNMSLDYSESLDENALFFGDQQDLTELLGNLLDNACKAANAQVLLSIGLQNDALILQVEDDGQGISSELHQTILERGKRADTYEKGHGVGLAIVRDLVDSYQGELCITPSPRLKGACFTLRFKQQGGKLQG
ncbi:ATP-binding protein [Shewanella sp. AS1]|uniref:ATP-binding protein n=1 Tax=Shewanella sp. AS1 TaxID=2907626 RepID=UPI001F32EEDA|nr:ATP-binding protein [Shewanella sp. AS1]MCE9678129.1 ATP-binding protein [Shewanella sp. AS1]